MLDVPLKSNEEQGEAIIQPDQQLHDSGAKIDFEPIKSTAKSVSNFGCTKDGVKPVLLRSSSAKSLKWKRNELFEHLSLSEEDQLEEVSSSSSDPFSSGKESWLGDKNNQDSSSDSDEDDRMFSQINSAMEDEGEAAWSMQRAAQNKPALEQVAARFQFSNR